MYSRRRHNHRHFACKILSKVLLNPQPGPFDMCGICGYLRPGCDPDTISLRDMTDAIRRRGPDTGKLWHEAASGIALGHRRLSIQDLSDAGVQPMASACGRYICVFNGEIYNYRALRHALSESGLE